MTTLSDAEMRRSIYIAVLMTFLLPPFVGGTIMGLVGFYPMPEFYLIFISYAGPYVLLVLFSALALVPRAYRYIYNLTQQSGEAAAESAQYVFARMPWYLLFIVTFYSVGGSLSADISLEAMGIRQYTVREHLYNLFGLIPVVLITAFPIFFYFIDRLGRYLAPRGISVTAIPLWVKLLMLGIVTPLLIDSLLIGYYYNRTGFFQWETLAMWVSLVLLAAGGTWLAWRSLQQGLTPLQRFISSQVESIQDRAHSTLLPLSLDELGVLTARYAEILSTQQNLSGDLQRTRQLADAVIENAGALVIALDNKGRIVRFNRACEKLSGLSFAEVEGKYPWETFLPPEDADTIRKHAFEALANNPQAMAGSYTNYWVTKKGERPLLEFTNTVILDAQGRMDYMISVGTDITERDRQEKLLAESEARLNAAQHMAKIGSWVLDLVNNSLHWSDEIFNIFEIDQTKFGATYEAFLHGIHPDDRDAVNQAYGNSLVDRTPYEIVHRLLMEDGRIKYVRETCESFFDADDKPLRSVGTVQDISELHKVEEALRQHQSHLEKTVMERTASLQTARLEAERASAAKSEFLSRMSHELRTPLNAILGFGQLLEMEQSDSFNQQQQENIKEILTAGNNLLLLINEILDLSQIENGYLQIKLESVSTLPLIQSCVVQLRPLALKKKISFALPDMDYSVKADVQRLRDVLENLLSNAIKYNRENGAVYISCTPVAGERMRFSIRDTGRGIAADNIPRLFKPFERMESAYEGIEGSGIGLALAKKLVKAMQGEIGVESVPGEGSTFWFELPLLAPASVSNIPTPALPVPPADVRRKILYIEDNPANMRLVKKIIEFRKEFEFHQAENAEAGLEIATELHPDLILLDIQLPGMDGYAAMQQLRENPLTQNIPVIAVSANAMPKDIERSKQAGFADYLTKPIEVKRLLDAVNNILKAGNN